MPNQMNPNDKKPSEAKPQTPEERARAAKQNPADKAQNSDASKAGGSCGC